MTDHRVVVALSDPDVLDHYRAQFPQAYDVETTTSLDDVRTALSGARVAFVDRAFFPDDASPSVWLETVDPCCRVALVARESPGFDPVRAGFDTVLRRPADGDAIRDSFVRLLRLARYDDLIREYSARATVGDDVEPVRRALGGVVSQLDRTGYKAAVRDPVVDADGSGRRKRGSGRATPPVDRRVP